MRSYILALFVGSSSAAMTANVRCNVDKIGTGDAAWATVTVSYTAATGTAATCNTAAKTAIASDGDKATHKYCANWTAGAGTAPASTCTLWKVKTPAGGKVVVPITAHGTTLTAP